MTESAKAVLADALRLDEPADADADAAWEAEIRRRIESIASGTAELESWKDAKRRIEKEVLRR